MRDWLQYHLERWLLRGAAYRLALLAGVIVLVSVVGGLAVVPLASPEHPTPPDAVWWAFLRLTDPGYLGDDQGLWKRLVSVWLTLAGYVLFMGALIAVMTQALDATLERLERGETPIVAKGHLLVVGWTDRTAAIVREFLLSERRVQRFLQKQGGSRLHIVLMVEELSPAIQSEIAERFGDLWDESLVTLRSGSRLRMEHLERVAFDQAAAIVLPGTDVAADFAGSDIAVIKTLLSIANHPALRDGEHPPRVVAEIFDRRKVSLANVAYAGTLDVVPSDLHISRLIVQNLRSPGLSHVYGELLTHHHGAAVYARQHTSLTGLTVSEAAGRFERAVFLGVVRRGDSGLQPALCPPGDMTLEAEDRAVLVAQDFEDTNPEAGGPPRPIDRVIVLPAPAKARKVLILGWSDKVPTMLAEMGSHGQDRWSLVVVSVVPVAEREAQLADHPPIPDTVELAQIQADFTVPQALRAIDPEGFDAVVLLGSDWLRSDEEADARSLVGYLTLREVLGEAAMDTHILVELTDPVNASLFDRRRGEVVVSPMVISNLLAHVTLRAEILPVFDMLFSAGGPSLLFREPEAYELTGVQAFATIALAVRRKGHVAIGLRRRGQADDNTLTLAPSRTETFALADHELVVMAPTAVRVEA